MLCLQSFLFLFLIPFPQVSTFVLLAYLLLLILHHKPCLYCSAMIVALLCSSCALYGNESTGSRCWLDLDPDWLFVPRLSNMVYVARPAADLSGAASAISSSSSSSSIPDDRLAASASVAGPATASVLSDLRGQ